MDGNGTTYGIVCESITQVEGNILRNLTSSYGMLTLRIFQQTTDPIQRQALVDLYQETGGPNWSYGGISYSQWATDTDPCQFAWVLLVWG